MEDSRVDELMSAAVLTDMQLIKFLMDVDPAKINYSFMDESKFEISGIYTRRKANDKGQDSCEFTLLVGLEKYPDNGKKNKKRKPSLKTEIVVRGIVAIRFDEGHDEDEKDQILCANIISLLYGEVRSHTMLMTSVSPAGKLILPAIDPWVLAERVLRAETEMEVVE